ncbi:hypothetical protein F511_40903 [Dorcoceras hygrometricum]|uniref:Dystroglycan-like n=1 Tax=Dorcoceras hygrometricum TaxID=472368 RepID=A0A2Z7C5T8_9LAMI|nr:hypothetical protein F511_40903 [Dorcoceras hygrometricum]
MASSLYSNAQHVNFESVLGMDDPGMVSMFEALMASGLRGFLGCPAIVYEDALVDFFENASVRSGVVISTVGGQLVEISEKLFAETFELPIDGLGDLSEMPKDEIFDARSIVSLSGEPINLSGRKNQMKMPFRLLCDIVAKAISVKAGSFNAITVEKFSLITAVVCKIKMNWAKFLFGVLKKMVSARSKQAKGFAIQISALLATFPSVEISESSEFPASKILSKKTVLRFISINDRDGAEEVSGAAKKKAVSKKRPAADIEAAVPKKKRTSKKKSISSISSLEMVAVAEEAVPIQQVAEPLDVEEPRCSSADAVDLIIQQVLDETRAADAPADTAEPAVTEEKHWFDLPYDDLVKQWEAERPVVTASDTEDEIATEDVAPADGVQQVEEVVAPISAEESLSADEQMSLDDILLTIPVDIPLPSTCMERFDKLERRRGVHCFGSADEVFSRYFVEEVQQLLSRVNTARHIDSGPKLHPSYAYILTVISQDRSTGLVRATAISAPGLSMAQHSTMLICQLAPDLVHLATTQQASKLKSTNYTPSALRAATETPATLNCLLSMISIGH